jgi:hypothetical protein
MIGPGKYDRECTVLREDMNAQGVVVIVMGGDRGDGFSAQMSMPLLMSLPEVLRRIADAIAQDAQGLAQ